jgi:hypothetical protein
MGFNNLGAPCLLKTSKTLRTEQPQKLHKKGDNTLMASNLIMLEENEILKLTQDARIAGIRWDVIPWCLVLDLDVPISEARQAPMRRAWIVFHGVSELTFPAQDARLPNGCWLTSTSSLTAVPTDYRMFCVLALMPRFIGNESSAISAVEKIVICARRMVGVVSSASATPGDSGLAWENRIALATDEEMRVAVGNI